MLFLAIAIIFINACIITTYNFCPTSFKKRKFASYSFYKLCIWFVTRFAAVPQKLLPLPIVRITLIQIIIKMITSTEIEHKESDIENLEVSFSKSGFFLKAGKISRTGILDIIKVVTWRLLLIMFSAFIMLMILRSSGIEIPLDFIPPFQSVLTKHQRAP
jgi:hypothetical protein